MCCHRPTFRQIIARRIGPGSGLGPWGAALVCIVPFAACAPPPAAAPRPNVVLISIDSLRADHVGAYGYERDTSPNIDRIAAEGIVFEHAFSTTTWTLPSHLSLLSGLLPDVHGVFGHDRSLGVDAVLLPELLADAGYRSAAVVSGLYLDRRFGYLQGWESYDDSAIGVGSERESMLSSHQAVTSPEVHAAALATLDRLGAGPFFLFLHYWDVHYDYIAPPPFDRMFDPDYEGEVDSRRFIFNRAIHEGMPARDLEHVVALYDGEIRWVDDWLGKLFGALDQRDLWGDTAVIVTADHGEEFFEHGQKGHQRNLHDTTLRIPLVVRLPGGRLAGHRVTTPVSIVDVAPTVAGLAGLTPHASWNGRDLIRSLDAGAEDLPIADVFADLRGYHKVLIRGDWKLFAVSLEGTLEPRRGVALYDRRSDPGERTNLAQIDLATASRMFVDLRRSLRVQRRLGRKFPTLPSRFDASLERELRALGYL